MLVRNVCTFSIQVHVEVPDGVDQDSYCTEVASYLCEKKIIDRALREAAAPAQVYVEVNSDSLTHYVSWVASKLPPLEDEDLEEAISVIRSCYDRKFTKEDALAYVKLTEHVDPDLDEEVALARMSKIYARYSGGKCNG